jgi:thiazole synthase
MELPPQRLSIGGHNFTSQLLIGSGKFATPNHLREAINLSRPALVTVALKRMTGSYTEDPYVKVIEESGTPLLPNTSGARNAKEGVLVAQLAREALETNFIKLEIHPDQTTLLPDPLETYEAARQLVELGFIVMPYINADPVLCKRLEDVGVQCVMPLGSPIGSNLGLTNHTMLEIIIRNSQVPVIIDAGIGSPSDAALAMELGASGVLINTAIATAKDPARMAYAFKLAVVSGSMAQASRTSLESYDIGHASSPFAIFS